ncbi:MAG: GAF domain-containing protein [Anaerolineales bacterium]
MNSLVSQLIQQHFGDLENTTPELKSFLKDLEDKLAMQYSEQNLQTILNSMPFGITIIDYQKNILHANQSALNLMGYNDVSEIRGHICHDTLCPAAEGSCPILDLQMKVDRSERVLFTKDHAEVPILKSVTPIMYNGEEVLLEAFVDITERKQLQDEKDSAYHQRGQLASQTNAIIRTLAKEENSSKMIKQLTDLVHEHMGADRVQYFAFVPAGNNLKMIAAAGEGAKIPTAQHAILPINVGAAGKAAATRTTVQAEAGDLQLNQYPQIVQNDVRCQVALPVLTGEEIIGVLDIQLTQQNKFDPDTLLFLETLVQQTGIIMESFRNREEMEEKLKELTYLQRMTSTEGWKTFSDLANLSAPSFEFDTNLQTTVPVKDTHSLVEDPAHPTVIKPLEVRGEVIGKLGITTDSEQPLSSEEQQLLDSISSEVAEALERARLFETSQRSASELAILNEMGASFAQALNEDTITENIFIYTSKLMETPQFYVALFDETDKMVSFPYVVMDGERVTEGHQYYDQWYTRPLGTGLTFYIIEHKVPILIDKNAATTLSDLGLPFAHFGGETQSWLGVPMVIGDRVLGVIAVQCETIPNLYNRHHLDLLTTTNNNGKR